MTTSQPSPQQWEIRAQSPPTRGWFTLFRGPEDETRRRFANACAADNTSSLRLYDGAGKLKSTSEPPRSQP